MTTADNIQAPTPLDLEAEDALSMVQSDNPMCIEMNCQAAWYEERIRALEARVAELEAVVSVLHLNKLDQLIEHLDGRGYEDDDVVVHIEVRNFWAGWAWLSAGDVRRIAALLTPTQAEGEVQAQVENSTCIELIAVPHDNHEPGVRTDDCPGCENESDFYWKRGRYGGTWGEASARWRQRMRTPQAKGEGD